MNVLTSVRVAVTTVTKAHGTEQRISVVVQRAGCCNMHMAGEGGGGSLLSASLPRCEEAALLSCAVIQRSTMERTHLLQHMSVFLPTLLILGSFASGKPISANFGDNVTFSASENCAHGDFRLMTRDHSLTVARRSDMEIWVPEERYKDRIEHLSLSSLNFSRVNINDEGLFEFTCRGSVVTRIHLYVFSPFKLSATEGQTVGFLCRSASAAVKLLRWERNGELVCELDPSSRGIRYGTGYEGRVSVPADWKLTGDLSLTLDRVQLEDEGQFICYIDESGTRGGPAAVMMKVNKKTPHQTTSGPVTTTQRPPEESVMGAGTIAGLITSVVFFILGFIFFCLWLNSADQMCNVELRHLRRQNLLKRTLEPPSALISNGHSGTDSG